MQLEFVGSLSTAIPAAVARSLSEWMNDAAQFTPCLAPTLLPSMQALDDWARCTLSSYTSTAALYTRQPIELGSSARYFKGTMAMLQLIVIAVLLLAGSHSLSSAQCS
jgi:hypothetical protein